MKACFTPQKNHSFDVSLFAFRTIFPLFFIWIFSVVSCFAQQYVSPEILSNFTISCTNDRVVTISNELDLSKKQKIFYYDGMSWNTIQSDSSPDFRYLEPNVIISKFSESIFIPFKENLWEYSKGVWKRHFIPDPDQKSRVFVDMLELADSTRLVSASFGTGEYYKGSQVYQNELFTFSNGEFLLPSLDRLASDTMIIFSKIKKYPNGNFSYFSNRFNGKDSTYEFVLFDDKENVLAQFSIPQIDEQYNNAQVKLTDYLFDSKGSIWFLTSSKREFLLDSNGNKVLDTSGLVLFTHNFPGLIEVNSNKEIKYYNANIGIDSSVYESLSFDIDKNDNIWFVYNNRFSFPDNYFLPTMYKLQSDRQSIQKYSIETILKNSKIYNGGKQNEPYEFVYLHKKLKVNHQTGSIYILTSRPLIEFFPNWIPSSINESSITPIHLYPNPIHSNNTITIESSVFQNVKNPLSVFIRDVNGTTIREETISTNGDQLQIDTQGLVAGPYYISILSNNKTILQTKFVKQ